MAIKDYSPWKFGKRRFGESGAPMPIDSAFSALQRQMNRVFDEFMGVMDAEPISGFMERFSGFSPRADFRETDEAFEVAMELPGMTEKDIDVVVGDDSLTIRGEKKNELQSGDASKGRGRFERSYGYFERAFPFPQQIDREAVAASFKHGVLTVTLPKTASAKDEGRKIPIRSE